MRGCTCTLCMESWCWRSADTDFIPTLQDIFQTFDAPDCNRHHLFPPNPTTGTAWHSNFKPLLHSSSKRLSNQALASLSKTLINMRQRGSKKGLNRESIRTCSSLSKRYWLELLSSPSSLSPSFASLSCSLARRSRLNTCEGWIFRSCEARGGSFEIICPLPPYPHQKRKRKTMYNNCFFGK